MIPKRVGAKDCVEGLARERGGRLIEWVIATSRPEYTPRRGSSMTIIRRILLLLAILLVAGVAIGWRASYRQGFSHWFRDIPIAGDIRFSGATGTLFIAIRRELENPQNPPGSNTFPAPGPRRWGFSWQRFSAPRAEWDESDPRATQRTQVGWFQLDFLTMPFWSVQVLSAFLVLILAAAEARRWVLRGRRRREGRCAGCGYDLTGNVSGVCSECGKADSKRAEQPAAIGP